MIIVGEPAKWIKISTDTFQDKKIEQIEGMPGGEKILITWIKILLLAGACNAEAMYYYKRICHILQKC